MGTVSLELKAVLLHVDDVPAATAFYRDVLGMTVVPEDPGSGYRPGVDWALLAAGPAVLELFDRQVHGAEAGTADSRPAGRLLLAFETGDLAEALARIGDRGRPSSIVRHAWGRCAYLSDPEGNRIQVYEPSSAIPAGG